MCHTIIQEDRFTGRCLFAFVFFQRKVAPDGFDLFHVSAFWAKLKLERVMGKDKKRRIVVTEIEFSTK
jgi:hypothetical protein